MTSQLRTRKDDVIREIHLYLSNDLGLPSAPLAGALPEIRARIEEARSALHFVDHISVDGRSIKDVIRFRRHVQARWDQGKKCFIPLDQPLWKWEPVVVFVVPADSIVIRVADRSFDRFAEQCRLEAEKLEDARGHDVQVFIMIRGIGKHYTRVKAARNREFEATARAELEGRVRIASAASSEPSRDDIESAMLEGQIAHRLHWVLGDCPIANSVGQC